MERVLTIGSCQGSVCPEVKEDNNKYLENWVLPRRQLSRKNGSIKFKPGPPRRRLSGVKIKVQDLKFKTESYQDGGCSVEKRKKIPRRPLYRGSDLTHSLTSHFVDLRYLSLNQRSTDFKLIHSRIALFKRMLSIHVNQTFGTSLTAKYSSYQPSIN